MAFATGVIQTDGAQALDLFNPFWVRLISRDDLGKYGWREVVPKLGGLWGNTTDLRSGTLSVDWAYEANLIPDVPLGTVVKLRLGLFNGNQAYVFTYPSNVTGELISLNGTLWQWEERLQDSDGSWVLGTRSGSAYEANNASATVGDIVRLYPGYGISPAYGLIVADPANSTQNLTLYGAVGGNFTLTFYDSVASGFKTTDTLSYNASTSDVSFELNLFNETFSVSGSPGNYSILSTSNYTTLSINDENLKSDLLWYFFSGCCDATTGDDYSVLVINSGNNPYNATKGIWETATNGTTVIWTPDTSKYILATDPRGNAILPPGSFVLGHKGVNHTVTSSVSVYVVGNGTTDQVQKVDFAWAWAGNYTLAFNNGTTTATTAAIDFTANSTTIKSALDALINIGNVTVAPTKKTELVISGANGVPYYAAVSTVNGTQTAGPFYRNTTAAVVGSAICNLSNVGSSNATVSNVSIQPNTSLSIWTDDNRYLYDIAIEPKLFANLTIHCSDLTAVAGNVTLNFPYYVRFDGTFTNFACMTVNTSNLSVVEEYIIESVSPDASLGRAGILTLGNQTLPFGWKTLASGYTGNGGLQFAHNSSTTGNGTVIGKIYADVPDGTLTIWGNGSTLKLGSTVNITYGSGNVAIGPNISTNGSISTNNGTVKTSLNGTEPLLEMRSVNGTLCLSIPTAFTGNYGGFAFQGGVVTGNASVPSSLGWNANAPASAEEAWQRIADWAYALIGYLGGGPLP
jgi:hypothetical protein